MFERIGRRLRLVFQADPPMASEPALPPVATTPPLVEFVAYGEDCLLSGRVPLAAERLTDLLNDHDELELIDVFVERLDGAEAAEAPSILVGRDDLLLVHATGPRGSQGRRQRTRAHPVALQAGPYHVRGYLHALPGSDPLTAIRRRKPFVPLTEAWVEFGIGAQRQRRQVGVLVINREQIDWIAEAVDEDMGLPELPDLPVGTDQGPLLKDFTGQIVNPDTALDATA